MILGPIKFWRTWDDIALGNPWMSDRYSSYTYVGVGERLATLVSRRGYKDGSSYPSTTQADTEVVTTFNNVMFTNLSNKVLLGSSTCPGVRDQNGVLLYRVSAISSITSGEFGGYEFGVNSSGHPYLAKGFYRNGSFNSTTGTSPYKYPAIAIANGATLSTGVHYKLVFSTTYDPTGWQTSSAGWKNCVDMKTYTTVTVTNLDTGVTSSPYKLFATDELDSDTVTSNAYLSAWNTTWDARYAMTIGQQETQFYDTITIGAYDLLSPYGKFDRDKVSVDGYKDALTISGISSNIKANSVSDIKISFNNVNAEYSSGGSYYNQWTTESAASAKKIDKSAASSVNARCLIQNSWLGFDTITLTYNNLLPISDYQTINSNLGSIFTTSNNTAWSCTIPKNSVITLPDPKFETIYNSVSSPLSNNFTADLSSTADTSGNIMFVGYRLTNTAAATVSKLSALSVSTASNITIYSSHAKFSLTSATSSEGAESYTAGTITRLAMGTTPIYGTYLDSSAIGGGKIYYNVVDSTDTPSVISTWREDWYGVFPTGTGATVTGVPSIVTSAGAKSYVLKFEINDYLKYSISNALMQQIITASEKEYSKVGGAIFVYHAGEWHKIFGEDVSTNMYDLGVVFG